jgi:phosphodiesterase/alkaline phosphatase D-like protein
LNGQVNPNGFASTYWFEYGTSNDLGNGTASQSTGTGTASSNVSVSLSNLSPLTKYYFRMNAQNPYGTVNGAIMSFTTTGPAAVKAPTVDTTAATSVATTAAQMNGKINPNGAETTYWFEYSEDSLLGSIIGNGTAPKTLAPGTNSVNVTANLTGLKAKTTYYYHLVARNSSGTVDGDIVSFKTK